MPVAETVNEETKAIALPKGVSKLQRERAKYEPKLPAILRSGNYHVQPDSNPALPPKDAETIKGLFPNTYGKHIVRILNHKESLPAKALTVGVVLSGGPAPGGHNCIAGLFDALKAANAESRLLGFIGGPRGVIDGRAGPLTE